MKNRLWRMTALVEGKDVIDAITNFVEHKKVQGLEVIKFDDLVSDDEMEVPDNVTVQ
jgi:hypothetical protein